ncbi:DinB family protein [Nocardia sp. NPDC050630]|uniref:DinB family protein n=1 Tax=Nocardia sp. NPDC050630 TaxID=3364321 RepID=UPI0037A0B741
MRGHTPPDRTEIMWPGPGPASIDWLHNLRQDWLQVLDRSDLDAPTAFPWQNDPDKSVAHAIAWVNAELMKNATEIGQLRLLRAASGHRP